MGQDFPDLGPGDALFDGAVEIEGKEGRLARRDQHGNGYEISVTRCETGSQPNLVVEQIVGELPQPLGDRPDLLIARSRAVRSGRAHSSVTIELTVYFSSAGATARISAGVTADEFGFQSAIVLVSTG